MSYKNAAKILPEKLLFEIQQYAEGEVLYIPKKSQKRIKWGEKSGTRKCLAERDREICKDSIMGVSVSDLANKYYLSEKSIQRILRKGIPSEKRNFKGGYDVEQRK